MLPTPAALRRAYSGYRRQCCSQRLVRNMNAIFVFRAHGNAPVHFGRVLRKLPLSRALPRNDHLPKIRKCSPSNREANRFRIIIPRPASVELSLPETILGRASFLRRAHKLRWAPSRRTTLMAKSRAWPKIQAPAFRVIRRRHPGTFSADESNSTDTSTSPRRWRLSEARQILFAVWIAVGIAWRTFYLTGIAIGMRLGQ